MNAADAQRIADELTEKAQQLRADIAARRTALATAKGKVKPGKGKLAVGSFGAWERHALTIAKLVGQLDRIEARLPAAIDRARHLRAVEREKADRLAEAQAIAASFERRAQALAAADPNRAKRWERERAEEEKRVRKLSKALRQRNSKDLREPARPARYVLPPPMVQPPPEALKPDPSIPPPRPDLLPGEFVEPERAQRIIGALLNLDARRSLPEKWTPEHVGDRLREAHAILRRMPMTTRPKAFGTIWPEYKAEAGDLVHQVSTGALADRNRVTLGVSADEVLRMQDALAWPLHYLADDLWRAEEVNLWAMDAHPDLVIGPAIGPAFDGLTIIAHRLNARKVVVK